MSDECERPECRALAEAFSGIQLRGDPCGAVRDLLRAVGVYSRIEEPDFEDFVRLSAAIGRFRPMNDTERDETAILKAMGDGPVGRPALIERTRMSETRMTSAIARLRYARRIRVIKRGVYERCEEKP